MANTPVSSFSAASALGATDLIPVIQGSGAGSQKKATGTQLTTYVWTSPTLVTPTLGVATATSVNKVAITAPATSATLTIADGKTLTASNTLTLAGTDSTTMTFPSTSATVARTDAGNTFTGSQTVNGAVGSSALTLTGGTQTTSQPALSITQTWNAGGVTFSAFKIAVTRTAAATGSLHIETTNGSQPIFSVSDQGVIRAGVGASDRFYVDTTNVTVAVTSNGLYKWGTTTNLNGSPSYDTAFARNAAGVVEVNNGTAGTYRDLKLRNLIPGASLSTGMTDGFVNLAGAAGAASGTPANTTGFPCYWDSTNLKLMVYTGGAWKASAAFT